MLKLPSPWTWLLAAAALAIAFWPTLVSFPAVWAGDPYTYGWIVAALCAWLVWRQRRVLRASSEADGGWPLALLPMAALSLVWLLATITNVQVVHQAALPLLLVCFGAAVLGLRAGLVLLPIGATFLLAVPLWEVLSPVLQAVTVAVSGVVLGIVNVPATIEGNLIHINAGTFEIADACSGLRYLMAGLVIGAFYAHLFVEQWRSRAAVMALAAGIAIVANWVRVSSLIVIGHISNMEAGIIFHHGPYGWWLFAGSLMPFFLLARGVEKREMQRIAAGSVERVTSDGAAALSAAGLRAAGLSAAADADAGIKASAKPGEGARSSIPRDPGDVSAETSGRFEPSHGGGPGATGRDARSGTWPRVALAAAIAIVGPAIYFIVGALPEAPTTPPALYGQTAQTIWQAIEPAPLRPFSWQPAFEGADEHHASAWSDGETAVYVDRLVYRNQAQGTELVGYANRIAPDSIEVRERMVGPLDRTWRTAWEALVFAPEGPILVWYWYRVGGTDTASTLRAKILELPAFLLRRRTAELVAVSARCGPESCAEASATVRRFVLGPTSEPQAAADSPQAAGTPPGEDG